MNLLQILSAKAHGGFLSIATMKMIGPEEALVSSNRNWRRISYISQVWLAMAAKL